MPSAHAGTAGNTTKTSKRRKKVEASLQAACVELFGVLVRPGDALLLAIPNGEKRDPATAVFLAGKALDEWAPDDAFLIPRGQGVLKGATDMILATENGRIDWMEFKRPKTKFDSEGTLSKAQKIFKTALISLGHPHHVITSIDDFLAVLKKAGVRTKTIHV